MKRIAIIRSGGQTGVDRGALDAALHVGVPIQGWCPKCGLAEDLPDPPGLLDAYPQLVETPSPDYEQRTFWNVRDSHATLIVLPDTEWRSRGTAMTVRFARQLARPMLIVTPDQVDEVRAWLETLGFEITLNVAGPRESLNPGIAAATFALIEELLKPECTH